MNYVSIPGLESKSFTIEQMEDWVCEDYDTNLKDLKSKKRHGNIKEARQILMYLTKRFKGLTHEKVSARYNRDHSTCVYSSRLLENYMETNKSFNKYMTGLITNFNLR